MGEICKCPVCGMIGETTVHTILYCWWAQVFWKNMPLECRFLDIKFLEPGDWIWNNLLFGKNGQSPQTAARYVYQQAWSLCKGEEKFIVTELSDGVRWSNPRRGAVKVNVDGAWDSATRKAGVGISCRDKWGCVRFVEAFPVEGAADCLEVEQLALARAMAIVEEENLINVTFETDSVQVTNGLMRGDSFGGQSRVLLYWCKGRLEDNISWDLSLISREANECADYLAKKAKREDWSWRSRAAVPLCLSSVLN
ncbi:unnamed protein product [Rhodiola kirilowii]